MHHRQCRKARRALYTFTADHPSRGSRASKLGFNITRPCGLSHEQHVIGNAGWRRAGSPIQDPGSYSSRPDQGTSARTYLGEVDRSLAFAGPGVRCPVYWRRTPGGRGWPSSCPRLWGPHTTPPQDRSDARAR
jgi:hypothetical protein